MENKLKTKTQIKVDRLFSCSIGGFGILVLGFGLGRANFLQMIVGGLSMLMLMRVDKLNNDLEYGRFAKSSKGEKDEKNI